MWLSLIVAVLTYFMQPRGTSKERRSALLGAVAAGGITYGVTEYTDWGKTNLAPIDGAIKNVFVPAPDSTVPSETTATLPAAGTAAKPSLGIIDQIKDWAAPALAGVVGGAALGSNSYLMWGLIGLGIYLVVK